MGEGILTVIDIKDHEFQKIYDRIDFESNKVDEAIKDLQYRLEILSEEVHTSFTSIIKDTREKIHDSFLAIMKDVENKQNSLFSELAEIRVIQEVNKSNIKCIENIIADILWDVDKLKVQNNDTEAISTYDIEHEIIIDKLNERILSLENDLKILKQKPKGFFKRLFNK